MFKLGVHNSWRRCDSQVWLLPQIRPYESPGKSSMGKVTQTRTICFPQLRVEFMIFVSDSHDLGWWALGIRPIPAFAHGCPSGWWGVSKYSRIPNLVKFWLPIMENWPSGWPCRGAAKRSHCAKCARTVAPIRQWERTIWITRSGDINQTFA